MGYSKCTPGWVDTWTVDTTTRAGGGESTACCTSLPLYSEINHWSESNKIFFTSEFFSQNNDPPVPLINISDLFQIHYQIHRDIWIKSSCRVLDDNKDFVTIEQKNNLFLVGLGPDRSPTLFWSSIPGKATISWRRKGFHSYYSDSFRRHF